MRSPVGPILVSKPHSGGILIANILGLLLHLIGHLYEGFLVGNFSLICPQTKLEILIIILNNHTTMIHYFVVLFFY